MTNQPIAFKEQLLSAFPTHPVIAEDSIGNRAQGYLTLEALELEQFLRGHSWDQITLGYLSEYKGDRQAIIHFLSEDAVVYFLPAFLLASHQDIRDKLEIGQSVVQFLSRDWMRDIRPPYYIWNRTSPAQRKLIAQWLLTMSGRWDVLCGIEFGMSLADPLYSPRLVFQRDWAQAL